MLRVSHFDFDWVVLGYVLAITTVSGLLFGIAPALWSSRRSPQDALKEGGRGGSQSRACADGASGWSLARLRWRSCSASARTARPEPASPPAGRSRLRPERCASRRESIFPARGTITRREGQRTFFARLEDQLRAIPGVQGVGSVSDLPLTYTGYSSDFTVAGWPAGTYGSEVVHRRVTPDFFKVDADAGDRRSHVHHGRPSE